MAEAVLKEKLDKRNVSGIDVSSCGLEANLWSSAEPRLRSVIGAAYHHLENFRSRRISEDLVQNADLVLAMEERQVHEILSRFPTIRGKVMKLGQYARDGGDIVDFVDGYRGSFIDWLNYCHSMIDSCVDRLVDEFPKIRPSTRVIRKAS